MAHKGPKIPSVKRVTREFRLPTATPEPGEEDTTAFDLRVFSGGQHRPGNPFFKKFIKGIALDENFTENLKNKINETDDIVLLKEIYDDILAFNPSLNDTVIEFGETITERTRELADIDPSLAGVDEFKLAAGGVEEQLETEKLGKEQRKQIEDFAESFGLNADDLLDIISQSESETRERLQGTLGEQRDILNESLLGQGRSIISETRPGRLEALNTLGFASSESEVARAEAEAARQLEAGRLNLLGEFDINRAGILGQFDIGTETRKAGLEVGIFEQNEELRRAALSTDLFASSAGLDQFLSSKRAGLERGFAVADRQAQAAADRQAQKDFNRVSLRNALIGAGGQILGGFASGLASQFTPGSRREDIRTAGVDGVRTR